MTSESTPQPSCCLELVSENIFDGVHGYREPECLAFEGPDGGGHFTVDLKFIYPIKNVSVMVQPTELGLNNRFTFVNVHVGNYSDYENNPVLDSFVGPPTYISQLVSFTSSTPLHGQFVSVVERHIKDRTYLCAMEFH